MDELIGNIEIRKVTKNELPRIRTLALDIWPGTYAPILSQQQIEYMLDLFYSDEALLNDFSKPGYHFYILSVNGTDAGYAGVEQVYDSTSDLNSGKGKQGHWHLHKIYLSQHYQGMGLGKQLLTFTEGIVRNNNGRYLTLNVNRFNKALDFYKACSYEVLREEDTDIGRGFWMNDYIMRKEFYTTP